MTGSERTELNEVRLITGIRRTVPIVPAALMCLSVLVMLALDITVPAMADAQFAVFPLLVKLTETVSVVCGLLCLVSEMNRGSMKVGLTAALFLLFGVLIIISTCINGFSRDALLGVPYRYIGAFDLLVFMAAFMYCSSCIRSDRKGHIILVSYMMTADLVAAAFVYDWFISGIAAFRGKSELAAVFFHGNHYGYYLVMACAIAAGYCIYGDARKAAAGAVSLAVNLFALAVNRSLGCVLAAGTVLAVMVVIAAARGNESRRRSWIMILIAAVLTAVALIGIRAMREDLMLLMKDMISIAAGGRDVYAGHGRWMLWKQTADYIADRPVWGYGCEGIRYILDETAAGSPHNEPLAYAAFFGIPAAAAFCAGVISAAFKGLGNSFRKTGCPSGIAAYAVLGYFISSLFGVAMFYTAPFLFVFAGIASGCMTTE